MHKAHMFKVSMKKRSNLQSRRRWSGRGKKRVARRALFFPGKRIFPKTYSLIQRWRSQQEHPELQPDSISRHPRPIAERGKWTPLSSNTLGVLKFYKLCWGPLSNTCCVCLVPGNRVTFTYSKAKAVTLLLMTSHFPVQCWSSSPASEREDKKGVIKRK